MSRPELVDMLRCSLFLLSLSHGTTTAQGPRTRCPRRLQQPLTNFVAESNKCVALTYTGEASSSDINKRTP